MGVLRSPLVLVSGNVSQLPPGDFISGDTVTAVAGSGLVGGGTDVNEFRFDVGLATPSSGLIYVGTKLALDGVAQRLAEQALASGNLAIASGNAAQFTANQALASGNLAFSSGVSAQNTANVALASGNAAQLSANNALVSGNLALASGNAAQQTANNALSSGNLAIASGNAAQNTANNALSSGNLAIASGNAAISLSLVALASGNAGIAQALAGVRALQGGSGLYVAPVGGSGIVTVHSSGVTATAGSGLVGGGTNTLDTRFDVALATTPSGLIFVNSKLALDGAAQASGNAGIAQALAGVTRLIAGTNITLSPTGGSGVVTVTAAGGGATGSGTERVFFENQTVISGSYVITSGFNAGSFGPVTLVSGVVITVPSGSVWTVV